jgi:glutamate racemase
MTRIAVIAGTQHDTAIGCHLAEELGLSCVAYPLVQSAQEQNDLQYFHPERLYQMVAHKLAAIRGAEYDGVLIFCNSLSLAIPLDKLRHLTDVPVFSPVDVYPDVAQKYRSVLVLTANGQCLAGTERILRTENANLSIRGYVDLCFATLVEAGLKPEEVIRATGLGKVIDLAETMLVDSILLACTHLARVYPYLQAKTQIAVCEPGTQVLKHLLHALHRSDAEIE